MSTQEKNNPVSVDAVAKLEELLHCGNERVELSAAKELLAIKEAEAEKAELQRSDAPFTVEIRIIDGEGETHGGPDS